jgi:predicted ATPase/class 3 adenylate cyclase
MSVLTFLFTDIEGSTRRWDADPEAMREALADHDTTLRHTIENHRGSVFKHTGDGLCAVFDSPKDAVDAAVAAQRRLRLPVRMGIATGEAERRDGDYFGAVLNRASRIMSAGHGGQILLDGATEELLSGVELVDYGSRRLRDITRAVRLFRIRAPGLRDEFPPLRTTESTPGNLRVPVTSFHGRQDEIADLQTAIKAHRLVTLTGPGGVGKTRLALQVAASVVHDFPDGVFVVELASVTDPDAVPDAVAAVLGISQQPGMNVADSVAAALQERMRLLIFDNCEHLLDAAADVIEAILTRSSTVAVLATSREGLRIGDELLWPVPSLPVETGSDSAAAHLFMERASAVTGGVAGFADDAVIEICRRLDGIPLAIELAASRLMSMTVPELRDRLDDRFRLLVGSRRGLERHQTLRHAVQWSYDLLDEREKELLTRCSVFTGGFDLAAAVAVAASHDDLEVLDLLDALVRKSLLTADRSTDRTRFVMLETIRQFAEEQLTASGSAETVRISHAHHYATLEGAIMAMWDSPRQREAYEWLAIEMPNLRSAFRWAADNDDLDAAAAITYYASMVGFWCDLHEPIRWAEELVEPARDRQHGRLAQLYSISSMCFMTGRIEDSIPYTVAGQDAILSGRFDEVQRAGEAAVGTVFAVLGDVDRWLDWCRATAARHPDVNIHRQALLVQALVMAGADDEACAAADHLLALTETTENPALLAWALYAYGTAQRSHAPLVAYDVMRKAREIAYRSGSRQTESNVAAMLTTLAAIHGEPTDALDYAASSIRNLYDQGNFLIAKNSIGSLAALFDRIGQYEAAATLSGAAQTVFVQLGFPEVTSAIEHLRDVLGDDTYESLACIGENMSDAEIATYAFEQIDRVRAELDQTRNEKSPES